MFCDGKELETSYLLEGKAVNSAEKGNVICLVSHQQIVLFLQISQLHMFLLNINTVQIKIQIIHIDSIIDNLQTQ